MRRQKQVRRSGERAADYKLRLHIDEEIKFIFVYFTLFLIESSLFNYFFQFKYLAAPRLPASLMLNKTLRCKLFPLPLTPSF